MSHKILVAEDDEFILKVYQSKLGSLGYELITATNGEETIKKAKETKPNLILLDLIMPNKNGFDVLVELNKDDETKLIPVIILSNLSQETDIQRGKELGADAYMIKSNVTIDRVVEKIQEQLG